MIADVWTVLWKEWREVFYARGSLKKGLLTDLGLPVLVLGVFLPLITREAWVGTPGLILYIWMPPYLAVGIVANSFAGERERHTLETLLATRLPDAAILLGKMLAAITYGLAITLLVALLGAVVVNIFFTHGELVFFSPVTMAVILFASLLLTSTISGAGVLISMRAATVRQAAQRLSFVLVMPGMVLTALSQLLPKAWVEAAAGAAYGAAVAIAVGLVVGLVALDIGLFLACLARFKRDRLILGPG